MTTDGARAIEAGLPSTNRLEAFSDGVFAVAITLLVLDLHVGNGRGRLVHDLGAEWPHYATYVVSFLTIGIIWVNHHGQYQLVARVTRPLLFLNLLLLLAVTELPFPTGILAEHLRSGRDAHAAAGVYAGSLLAMGICFFAVWAYLMRHRELLAVELDAATVVYLLRRNLLGLLIYATGVGLAWVSAPVTLALCGITACYYALPPRRERAGSRVG